MGRPGPAVGLFGLDRKVELAVIQHLGPEAAVDELTDVLDEHAIFVRRDRPGRLFCVDGDCQLLWRGWCALLSRLGSKCAGPQEHGGSNHHASIVHVALP